MTVTFLGETYQCTKAVKSGDSAKLYLSNGGVVEFKGVSDWSVFDIEDGVWETDEPTELEKLRADLDFLSVMTGVSL